MIHNYMFAILYVGQPRTIRDTLPFLKKNILLTPNVHVFACLQIGDNNSDVKEWLTQELGDHLKSFQWFDINAQYETSVKNKLNEHPLFNNDAKNYNKHSGAINSYMHMAEAYKKMWEYEQYNKITYDYVMRCRTDVIIDKKIDFRWMSMTIDEISDRLDVIQTKCNEVLTEEEKISYFMNTLITDHHNTDVDKCICHFTKDVLKKDCTVAENIKNILEEDNFALLQVYELTYLISRKNYYFIPFAGVTSFGYMYDQTDDFTWWCSESQFFGMVKHANINIFNNLYCLSIPPDQIYSVCKDTKGIYKIKRDSAGSYMHLLVDEAPTVVTEILDDYNLKLFKCPNPVIIYTKTGNINSIVKFHVTYQLSPVRVVRTAEQYNLSFYLEHVINNSFTLSHRIIWINPNIQKVNSTYITKDNIFMLQFNKIKICQLQYLNTQIVTSQEYITTFKNVVSTDFISGPKQEILLLCHAFNILSKKLALQGYNPLPEIIIGVLIVMYPDMFDVYYGDTENVLNNIVEYRGGEQAIITMLLEADKHNDIEFKEKVYKSIRKSIFHHLIPVKT